MNVGWRKNKRPLCCVENQGGFCGGWVSQMNSRVQDVGCPVLELERSFLNSVTNLGGNIDFSQNFITFQVSPSVQSLDPSRIQSTLFGPEHS